MSRDRRPLALVVEDLPEVRDWLAEALAKAFDGIEVGRVGTLSEARAWLAALESGSRGSARLKMALIDLGLPDGSGIDLVRELTERHPHVLTIVATIFDDDEHLFPAIAAGAQGYLLKEQEPEALARHLRMIDEGLPPLSPSISRRMLAHFRERGALPASGAAASAGGATSAAGSAVPAARVPVEPVAARADGAPSPGAESITLSPRETEVLSYIGRGLRVGEAAKVLGLTEHTVAGYVKTLYRKLNISSRAEAALEAARRGLV